MKNSKGDSITSAPNAQMLFTINSKVKLKENDILIKAKEGK
jgi:putative protease